MANLTFNAIDVETANRTRASICQIGLVIVRDGTISDAISILVNPEEDFEPINTSIHGIGSQTVQGALTMPLIHPKLSELTDGGILISHSSFDRQALERATQKYSLRMPQVRWLDSGRIARAAWPERYGRDGWNLKKIAEDLGISFQHHEAVDDARVSAEIVLRACSDTGLGLDEWIRQAGYQQHAAVQSSGGTESGTNARGEPPEARSRPTGSTPWYEILAKILEMEEQRGFPNHSVLAGIDRFFQKWAVFDGIDGFFERWAQTITEELGGSGIHRILLGIRFADLNPEERTWLAEQWRGVLAGREMGNAGTGPPEVLP